MNADITWVQVIWTDRRNSNSPRPILLTFEYQSVVLLLLFTRSFFYPRQFVVFVPSLVCSALHFFFPSTLLEDGRLPQAFYPPFKRDQALPRLFTHCQASTLQVRPLFGPSMFLISQRSRATCMLKFVCIHTSLVCRQDYSQIMTLVRQEFSRHPIPTHYSFTILLHLL